MMIDTESNPRKLILFDFMETYIDTPMQDIAKLRQDTHHHWTLQRYPGEFNETRVYQRLALLDTTIAYMFATERYGYSLFQFMNLIRILPYAKDRTTVEYVFEQLGRI